MRTILNIGTQHEDLDTGSACAFQMAAAWMNECLTGHKRCIGAGNLTPPVLPTRVIDVGPSDGSQSPRLHTGRAERALYFTLSYRWPQGHSDIFQTTNLRLGRYKTAIPLEALPKSMQDAIFVTRRFGIQYLWIDALCIIQDSREDWNAEARDMAKIYKNSLLTISAAADNAEASQGIFRVRSRLQTRPFDSNTQWSSGINKYVFADRRATKDGIRPSSVLDTRAWVLQEQILSPRVLSFSNEELYWDCASLNASETFPDGIPDFYDSSLKFHDVQILKEAMLGWEQTNISLEQFYTSWIRIIEEYSERQMTKETDKLAAILGLAKEAAVFLDDRFLLGLWNKRLWRDLLWWVKDPARCVLPDKFVSPTWSWTSVNSPISFRLHGLDGYENIDQCIKIAQTEVEPNQSLPILRGKILARGRLLLISELFEIQCRSFPSSGLSSPILREDQKGSIRSKTKCLIVAISEFYVYALGLVAADDDGHHYKRVGLVSWRGDANVIGWNRELREWNSEEELKTLTIV
jgi:heterokaryon incompatibility protein (HET)